MYTEGTYLADYITTIGVDFRCKQITHNGKPMKLQIWDTAGHERFRAITNSYYRGVDLVVLVYDITNKESFFALKDWVSAVKGKVSEEVSYLIVGNKSDLWAQRTVSQEEAGVFAANLGASYIEASAKMGSQVATIFEEVAIRSVGSAKSLEIEPKIDLQVQTKSAPRRFFSGLC